MGSLNTCDPTPPPYDRHTIISNSPPTIPAESACTSNYSVAPPHPSEIAFCFRTPISPPAISNRNRQFNRTTDPRHRQPPVTSSTPSTTSTTPLDLPPGKLLPAPNNSILISSETALHGCPQTSIGPRPNRCAHHRRRHGGRIIHSHTEGYDVSTPDGKAQIELRAR